MNSEIFPLASLVVALVALSSSDFEMKQRILSLTQTCGWWAYVLTIFGTEWAGAFVESPITQPCIARLCWYVLSVASWVSWLKPRTIGGRATSSGNAALIATFCKVIITVTTTSTFTTCAADGRAKLFCVCVCYVSGDARQADVVVGRVFEAVAESRVVTTTIKRCNNDGRRRAADTRCYRFPVVIRRRPTTSAPADIRTSRAAAVFCRPAALLGPCFPGSARPGCDPTSRVIRAGEVRS